MKPLLEATSMIIVLELYFLLILMLLRDSYLDCLDQLCRLHFPLLRFQLRLRCDIWLCSRSNSCPTKDTGMAEATTMHFKRPLPDFK